MRPFTLFEIAYDNRQGVLMRVLMALSRRGLLTKLIYASETQITIMVDCTYIQRGQLTREWSSIVDVGVIRTVDIY